jgi:NADH-quinone oxidoreductase subunit J
MLLELIIFYFAAIVAVGAAMMMILQRNPVASVLYLIASLLAQAVLYIQLKAVFVGALLVIVYAGAIVVLFLFVIMLLNLRGEGFTEKKPSLSRTAKLALSAILFLEMAIIIKQMVSPAQTDMTMAPGASDFGSVKPVAELLYTKYIYPFELTSVLLLAAIVAAVVMAKKDKSDDEGEI